MNRTICFLSGRLFRSGAAIESTCTSLFSSGSSSGVRSVSRPDNWPRESLSRIRETGRSIEKTAGKPSAEDRRNLKSDRGRFSLLREDARCAGLEEEAGKKRE